MENSIMNTNGVLRLSTVSDFIGPSQNCILPLQKKSDNNELPQVKMRERKERIPKVLSNEKDNETDKKILVSLSDCLACSGNFLFVAIQNILGCITTAETVFLQSQTMKDLLHGLNSSKFSIITVSPQSVSSLAVRYNLSIKDMAKKISAFFKAKGATHVIDSSFARLITHRLVSQKLIERYENKGPLPLISSVCPGFVLYAEKMGDEELLTLLSTVRSPQALSGSLVKDYLARKMNINQPDEIFHACVMPCSDKKLEASRTEFIVPGSSIKEVDCVVSTIELEAELNSFEFSNFLEIKNYLSYNWLTRFEDGILIGDGESSTSGGLTEFLCKEFESYLANNTVIEKGFYKTKVIRDDLVHITYYSNSSDDPVFTFVKAYGFRNLRDILRKLKRNQLIKNIYFIEIMACPSACGGGGGQLRSDKDSERKLITQSVKEKYSQIKLNDNDEKDILLEIETILDEWHNMNTNYDQLFYTEFHNIKKSMNLNDW